MHDVLIVGIQLLAILAGVLFRRHDTRRLRQALGMRPVTSVDRTGRMNTHFDAMIERFDALDLKLAKTQAGIREFYHVADPRVR